MVDPASESVPAAMPNATDLGIETLRQLNAGAPALLARRARKARLVGERKPITAVFADIVGSTSLAERIDPEDWTLLINAAFDEMTRRIFAFEGTIAQLQGDAIISFFGAPVAHEDDPERAVRAALEMIAAMAAYRAEVQESHGIDFRIRIGVSTGLVLVGNVGSDLRYDYTAIGNSMNLASRLEAAAPPGEIYIAAKTERFVRPFFDLEAVGPLELKGKAEPEAAFRVLGERADPGRGRGIEGLDSPMVGREEELAGLVAIAREVRAGAGRTTVILGDPGLGKSRLLAELRSAIAMLDEAGTAEVSDTAWVTAQGSSYGARMPFHLVTSLILDLLGLGPTHSSEEVDTALRALVAEVLPQDAEAIAYLTFLLGIEGVGATAEGLPRPTGEFLSERLAATILRLLRNVAMRGPLVIVIEDVHWADSASVELLKALLTFDEDVPVFIVLTSRPEADVVGWELIEAARERRALGPTEIVLQPLGQDPTQMMIANLLEVDSLEQATRDLILARAEGNPLYVEEVIRMLIDLGAIEREGSRWHATGVAADVSIPDTVQGLVLARIDRLDAQTRQVLRLASCIDRQFPVALLEAVARATDATSDAAAAIAPLESANLLVLASTEPELEYRFTHALIADAAYETVLRQERRSWHATIGEAILTSYPNAEYEHADSLARHFEIAGDAPRATHYLLIAADRALSRNAQVDAGALYQHADDLLRDVGDSVEADQLRLRVALGRLATKADLQHRDIAVGLIREGRRLAERLGDEASLADLLFWEIGLRQLFGERRDEPGPLRDAITRLESMGQVNGDTVQRSQALVRTGIFLWWSGDFRGSLKTLDEANKLFIANGDAIGASMAESYMAADLASMGDFEAADERMRASRVQAEQADVLARLDFHLAEAALAGLRGDYGTSIRYAGECLERSMELGALGCATVSAIVLGFSQLASGQLVDARRSIESSIEYAVQGALAPMRLRGRTLLAAVDGIDGHMQRAESGFHQAMQGLAEMGGVYGEAEAHLARGLVMATHPDGDPDQALEDLDAAVEVFTTLEARPALARTYRARGLALVRAGDAGAADRALAQAYNMAYGMGLLDGPWPSNVGELAAAAPPGEGLRLVE